MKRIPSALILFCAFLFHAHPGWANPTQCGETGLLTQPSAETLNAGNICIGAWGNYASGNEGTDALIVPVTITMGLGTFMEAYGSYPNLLFNDDEQDSGRGFANVGFKFRVLGKRSSPFKIALDGQMRRAVADDPEVDGLTDYLGRMIASYKPGKFGLHANVGYLSNESPDGVDYDDQVVLGGGLEFFPVHRLRMIAELETLTEKAKGTDGAAEATLGFQYYLMPHLTLNLGLGIGLTDSSPDWRTLVGISGCQGVGNFITPIDRVIEPGVEESETKDEGPKTIKLRSLTPLLPIGDVKTSPVAKFEVTGEAENQEVVVTPEEKLAPAAQVTTENLAIAPVDAADALEAAPTPQNPIRAVVYRKFRLPETIFESDQWSLSEEGKKTLSLIANELRAERKWLLIRIDGHTDSVGPDRYNEELSRGRSVAAANHLILRDGIDPNRLFVKGFGESQPLATNDTPEGRSENRRLELLILSPQEVTLPDEPS